MSVTKYQIYLKTVEMGSFTAAARALNFTQSGVSHAIGSLEEELGVTLLVRSHGGVTPTADGRALAPYFQEMCALSHRLEQHAEDLRGLDTGLIRVATFTSVSEKWLPGMLKTFQEKYPRIEFELLPSNFNNEISDWVLHGQADCGFISLPTPAEKYLDYWLLQRDQWKVILPCDHPLAGRDPFPPEALEKYPLILLDEGDDYEIQAIFDHYKVRPRIQYTVQQDQTILAMVSGGLGISVMEELMLYKCAYPLAASTLPKVFHRDIGICVKDKNALSHSTQAFIDHTRHWVLQNFPEGAAISLPLRREGMSRTKAFAMGSLSGIVEPVFGILVVLAAGWISPFMPWLLAFAAGAMIYVVVEELIPEAHLGEHSNVGTLGVIVGFVVMMVLDVALG